jgi:hypothetical protein
MACTSSIFIYAGNDLEKAVKSSTPSKVAPGPVLHYPPTHSRAGELVGKVKQTADVIAKAVADGRVGQILRRNGRRV